MLKFLRKYNKIILVVGGSFLMVVFLLPQAVQQFGPNPAKQVQFRAAGKSFRGKDLTDATRDLQTLQQIEQVSFQETTFPIGLTPPLERPESTHWLLLLEEAEALGLIGGPEGGASFLDEVAEQQAASRFNYAQDSQEDYRREITERLKAGLRAGRDSAIASRGSSEAVDRTLARLRGVLRLVALYRANTSLSTREAAVFARELFDTAVVDVFVLGAGEFEDVVDPPTDDEVAAHFAAYKDVRASEDEFGIGYLRPPAVQVEALSVDRSVIRDAVVLDPIEVNKYWRQNQAEFGADFATARVTVESRLKAEKVAEVMDRVEELLRREFVKASRTLGTGTDGVRVLPEDWASTRPSYGDLAARVNELVEGLVALGTVKPATYLASSGWLDRAALARHPAASARALVAGQNATFVDLCMNVHELGPETEFGVQEGITFGPVNIPNFKMFYFRVLEARPESPPASLAEVEDLVREDMLRLRAYETLLERRESLRADAVAAGGFLDMYEEYGATTGRFDVSVTQDRVSMQPGVSPLASINTPEFREAVVALVDDWSPLQDVSEIPLDERLLAVPLPQDQSVAFVEVKGFRPVTAERARELDYFILQNARAQWTEDAPPATFGFASISERLGYEPVRRGDEEEFEDEFEDEEPSDEG